MELKERILEAVMEEFNEKGIKFTMDDVARRLGISKRTLYSVIREKETLFIEAVDYVFAGIKQAEQEILEDASLDTMEKIKRTLIAMPQKYQSIDFGKMSEAKEKYPQIYKKIEVRLETGWEGVCQLLEQAMAEGCIRPISIPVFQAMFTGTIEYYLSRSVLADSQIGYEEALEQMLDILIYGVSSEGSQRQNLDICEQDNTNKNSTKKEGIQ